MTISYDKFVKSYFNEIKKLVIGKNNIYFIKIKNNVKAVFIPFLAYKVNYKN